MRFLKHLVSLVSFALLAGSAVAAPNAPKEGVDFRTLAQRQPTDSGKKVEVIEFFGYFCPHCYVLDPALGDWVKKQGDRIDFKRVHVVFHPTMTAIQQAYVALEVMGKTEVMHKKFFDAMHIKRMRFDNEGAITDFIVKEGGIDRAKYLEVYNSFSVQTRLRRANKLQADYGIDSVPQIFVDGRFQTAPDMMRATLGNSAPETALATGVTQTLDALVDRVIKERAPAKADAAAPKAKK